MELQYDPILRGLKLYIDVNVMDVINCITIWPDFKGIETYLTCFLGLEYSVPSITIWPDFKGIETLSQLELWTTNHLVLQYDPILRGLKRLHLRTRSFLIYITIWPDFKGIETIHRECVFNTLRLQYDPILRGLKQCAQTSLVHLISITIWPDFKGIET